MAELQQPIVSPRAGMLIYRLFLVVITFACMFLSPLVKSEPTLLGQSGLVSMPDARMADEGTLRFGLSRMKPYGALWSSISMFPRLELSARYTAIEHTRALSSAYGEYKDKAFDGKFVLLEESQWIPQLSFGAQDFTGTRLFQAKYIVASKRFGDVDFTIGRGTDRINGTFGGIRYSPAFMGNWSIVSEYDAFNYTHDYLSYQSGAINKKGGFTLGINYHWGWLGAQLAWQDSSFGFNGYISIPLQQKEFIPKLDEPPVFTTKATRPTLQQWQDQPEYAQSLIKALRAQDFKNVRLWLDGTTLELGLSQRRISLVSRAVGRAVRTALLMSPVGTQRIKITYYTMTDLPVVTYDFTDLDKLDQFFSGHLTYGGLLKVLKVSYAQPQYTHTLEQNRFKAQQNLASNGEFKLQTEEEGQPVSIKHTSETLDQFQILPINLAIFFNDPSGAFKYDWFARARYQKYFGNAWFFNSTASASILENVSDVVRPSNSELPHVRSDVAEYKRQKGLKFENFLINKYFLLRPRIYARWSLGLYEEMFGGTGGQILYLPKASNWAIDLTVDSLKQRDVYGNFGFRNYTTTTALLAYHYRIKKYGVTLTLRGGKFLAKDEGYRFEFARRFRSGFKVGAWYTITNGHDITSPGSPSSPYHDKGVMMEIPLNTMLTKDTRAKGGFSLAPWTRDVGQMVRSPGDLYEIMDDPLVLDRPEYHLLSDFHK